MNAISTSGNIVVVTPVYNDWDCLEELSADITKSLEGQPYNLVSLVILNDNSPIAFNAEKHPISLPYRIVNLALNVGHQRAIAIGLAYAKEGMSDYEFIVVMDSDGEDNPIYLPTLCSEAREKNMIVFAERKERSESWPFKVGYFFYKKLFNWLTTHSISFGNYSCIPACLLPQVVINPDLWNHYSASIVKSKIKYSSISSKRSQRYKGRSRMNYQSLIMHGLSSIAVYIDIVIVRALILSFTGLFALFIIVIGLLSIRFFTNLAIPGWTSTILIALLNLGGSIFSIILLLLLIQLNQRRNNQEPTPTFYQAYIQSVSINE